MGATDDTTGKRGLWLALGVALVVAGLAAVVCGRPPTADTRATSSSPTPSPAEGGGGAPPPLAAAAPLPSAAPAPADRAPASPSASASPSPLRAPESAAARGAVLVEGGDKRSAEAVPDAPAAGLDKEAIRGAIAAIKPKIAECYESALAHDPDLNGSVTVDFTIEAVDGGGGVTAGEVNQTDMNAPFFEACVLKQVVDVPFPAPAGGGVVKVTYPFNFSNGAD